MKYIIREGVLLETVCGESMLVATYKARKYCPYIFELNEASVLIWKGIQAGLDDQEIAAKASVDFEVSEEAALEAVRTFEAHLKEHGYLIEVSD